MSYSFAMEDHNQTFPSASDIKTTNTAEEFTPRDNSNMNMNHKPSESVFSPLAPQFTPSRGGAELLNAMTQEPRQADAAVPVQYQNRGANEMLSMMAQQEPRLGDTAPPPSEVDLMNFRMGGSDRLFSDVDQNSTHNFYMGNSRAESVASNMWSDAGSSVNEAVAAARTSYSFDFLVKSLTSANNYVSMLTREQLSVLRSIRPALLFEFLQEVAKVRGEKRMRKAMPNECAFCKNNGENEDCYSSHVLKDFRGRVLCPVLRAFRCPRCGATGDRAHTIKYCPEGSENNGSDRSGYRRRSPASSLLLGQGGSGAGGYHAAPPAPPTPASSPSAASAALSHANIWGSFGLN